MVDFLVLGALLLGGQKALESRLAEQAEAVVVIPAQQIDQALRDWRRDQGRQPSPAEEKALIAQLVEEELWVREALALELDREDLVVRRRLTEKMRLLTADEELSAGTLFDQARELGLGREDLIVRQQLMLRLRLLASASQGPIRPTEAEVLDYYERHRESFRRPARLTASHIFVSHEQHTDPEGVAHDLLEQLRAEKASPQDGLLLGDAFILGNQISSSTAEEVRRVMGESFSRGAFAAPAGQWSGPVRSTYGLHLVWVERRRPETIAPFQEVRSRVLSDLLEEAREHRRASFYQDLRSRYEVIVEHHVGQAEEMG